MDSISTHLIELARLYEASARPVSTAFLLMAPLSLQQLPGVGLVSCNLQLGVMGRLHAPLLAYLGRSGSMKKHVKILSPICSLIAMCNLVRAAAAGHDPSFAVHDQPGMEAVMRLHPMRLGRAAIPPVQASAAASVSVQASAAAELASSHRQAPSEESIEEMAAQGVSVRCVSPVCALPGC